MSFQYLSAGVLLNIAQQLACEVSQAGVTQWLHWLDTTILIPSRIISAVELSSYEPRIFSPPTVHSGSYSAHLSDKLHQIKAQVHFAKLGLHLRTWNINTQKLNASHSCSFEIILKRKGKCVDCIRLCRRYSSAAYCFTSKVKKGICEWLAWLLLLKRPGHEFNAQSFCPGATTDKDAESNDAACSKRLLPNTDDPILKVNESTNGPDFFRPKVQWLVY